MINSSSGFRGLPKMTRIPASQVTHNFDDKLLLTKEASAELTSLYIGIAKLIYSDYFDKIK